MSFLGFKKGKDRSNVSLYNSVKSNKCKSCGHPVQIGKGRYYSTIIDRSPKNMAQILIDLYLEGYPIDKAYKIMQERLRRKDWLGL